MPATALRFLFVMAASLNGCATSPADDADVPAERYQAVVASPIRTDLDRRMDATRRPAEFLAFTQVKPGMQVLDISTGGGYTTQLLALAVGPSGKVWAQAQQPGPTISKRLADRPQPNIVLVARSVEDPVPAGVTKLDLITIVLNYHDLSFLPVDRGKPSDRLSVDRAKVNQRLFGALKPGGRLVIVDHSARAGTGITDGKTLHRIEESVVLANAQQAGFVLEAEGNFLRNPADPRTESSNDPLIPTDKFALRFVKPRTD